MIAEWRERREPPDPCAEKPPPHPPFGHPLPRGEGDNSEMRWDRTACAVPLWFWRGRSLKDRLQRCAGFR